MIGSLSSALKLSRMEQNSKPKLLELWHIYSHTDKRYEEMLHPAHAVSSTTEAFNEEFANLRSIFSLVITP